jgi:excisionase family DNA binding protein
LGVNETYLTVSEVAAALRLSEATVRRKIATEELAAHRFGPRSTRVAPGDLAAFKSKSRSLTGGQGIESTSRAG